jgi:hypothetical protein
MKRHEGRTVRLSVITISNLHGSPAYAADAEIRFSRYGSTLLNRKRAIDGSETGLKSGGK